MPYVNIYSTGGTKDYIEKSGVKVTSVESITSYPSILGGRVKTLHPKVFGGILARRDVADDHKQLEEYEIPELDLVIVDLYPFEETVESGAGESDVIEKIDIGGISLIRAAAKNHQHVVIIPSRDQYGILLQLLKDKKGIASLEDRKHLAAKAFSISSHYDTLIHNYMSEMQDEIIHLNGKTGSALRYGENPHQHGKFHGNLGSVFDQLHGKELSYNNLLDIDAAVNLMAEFEEPTFAILKHNNACGIASRDSISEAWKDALAGDPVSAFGGILICNKTIDEETANEIDNIFFEVILAPKYDTEALDILKKKKNRRILLQKLTKFSGKQVRTVLNGVLEQDKDLKTDTVVDMETVTTRNPTNSELADLEFSNKVVKHTKSNAIVLAKNKQLLASGTGQTSRVDALNQAIDKANHFKQDLKGAVMASDAFFPFPDCVEIAGRAGITAVVQPGGSVKDKDSIDYCNENDLAMTFTGIRHFKH